ncbi:hypothetical protein [Lentilactobacillus rapi]|uniref:hypothetical protein n=1 Tax=Lentilactobacillus rapi TaxID=481723 RepID=UPI000AE450B2|nr:hypothetical protein [Lentilactobacillus rapi]
MLATGNPQIMKLMTPAQIDSLVANLTTDHLINWQKVAEVFEPMPFDTSTAPDKPTKEWLDQLKEL